MQEHQEKIAQERRKSAPDEGVIRHWEREIAAFASGILRAQKRLGEQG